MSDSSHRRLQSIYDALDTGNAKMALQLCNKHLKKQQDVIVKALKSLALQRLGKPMESLELAKQLKDAAPTDLHVLQTLMFVYRQFGHYQDIAEMYETAAKKRPNNEEIQAAYFMALVRTRDFKNQQQIALKLHKQFKDNRYLFWSVMSIYLQTTEQSGTEPQKANLMLTLAERMMQKAANEGRITAFEELNLYLTILTSQKKYSEAISILESDLGQKCGVQDSYETMRTVLEWKMTCASQGDQENKDSKKNMLKDVVEKCKQRVDVNRDDWSAYTMLFDTAEMLMTIDAEFESVESLRQFVQVQISKEKVLEKPQNRGPFLAEIELEKRIIDKKFKIKTEIKTKIPSLLVNYVKLFASKPCCFDDVKLYLDTLSETEAKEFTQKITTWVETSTKSAEQKPHSSTKKFQILSTFAKLERYLASSTLSPKEIIVIVNRLYDDYTKCVAINASETVESKENKEAKENKKGGKGKPQKEEKVKENPNGTESRKLGDELMCVCASWLVELWRRSEDKKYIYQSIVLLEEGLKKSQYNFQFKLILIRLYMLIGAIQRAYAIYTTMDIKNIQLDTLSHLVNEHAGNLGHFDLAVSSILVSSDIYRSNIRETPEMFVTAYQFGTYSKIPEFLRFYDRLNLSISKLLNLIESRRWELLKSNDSLDGVSNVVHEIEGDVMVTKEEGTTIDEQLAKRIDNRDVNVIENYNPKSIPSMEKLLRAIPKRNTTYLKLMTLSHRILHAIFRSEADALLSLVSDLEGTIQSAQDNNGQDDNSVDAQTITNARTAVLLGKLIATIGEMKDESERKDTLKGVLEGLEKHFHDLLVPIQEFKNQQLDYEFLHRVTSFLESCNYAVITSHLCPHLGHTHKHACKDSHGCEHERLFDLKPFAPSIHKFLSSLSKTMVAFVESLKQLNEKLKSLEYDLYEEVVDKAEVKVDVLRNGQYKSKFAPIRLHLHSEWTDSLSRVIDEATSKLKLLKTNADKLAKSLQ